jgi:hypothetical protein
MAGGDERQGPADGDERRSLAGRHDVSGGTASGGEQCAVVHSAGRLVVGTRTDGGVACEPCVSSDVHVENIRGKNVLSVSKCTHFN